MAVTLRTLRMEELDAWYALCGQLFEVGPLYFRRHFETDPWADVGGIFVAEDAGRLVSSVRVFTRYLMLEGCPQLTGGIGEVCTLPEYRGQGISGRLLTMAEAYMSERGMHLRALYGVLTSHYGRHGFAPVQTFYRRVPLESLPELSGAQRVRAFEGADLPAAQGLYDLYMGQFPLSFWRGESAYWERWVLSEWKETLVLEENGRVAAYADVHVEDGVLKVWDAACVPGEEASLYALLGEAARRLSASQVEGPEPVLSGACGERVKEHTGHLMLAVSGTVCGLTDVRGVEGLTAGRIVQWQVDGF